MTKPSVIREPLYWFYGSASAAFGIKNYAFSYLLLIYSTAVLGIDAYIASIAIGLAILWDAFSDLLLGHWSDKHRSRLGRRHPFMYASLLILPVTFWLLFNPIIEITEANGFFYLLIFAILVRTGATLVEVPSIAQLPELVQDYDRRTEWLTLRQTIGWLSGNGLHTLNFLFWVGAWGLSSQLGYTWFSSVAAVIIGVSILTTALGTQAHGKSLPQPTERFRVQDIIGEIRQIRRSLNNRNFASLFLYGLTNGIAGGLSTAIYLYNVSYFFEFDERQIALTAIGVLFSPVFAYFLLPFAGKRFGKRGGAMLATLTYIILYPCPYILYMLGYWPASGSTAALACYTAFIIVEVVCLIISAGLLDSMMADVVEDSEIVTERRSEGLFYAARALITKGTSAGGILCAGIILSVVGFDAISSYADMTSAHRMTLVTLFLPLFTCLNLAAIAALYFYRIKREDHARHLQTLDKRAQSRKAPT